MRSPLQRTMSISTAARLLSSFCVRCSVLARAATAVSAAICGAHEMRRWISPVAAPFSAASAALRFSFFVSFLPLAPRGAGRSCSLTQRSSAPLSSARRSRLTRPSRSSAPIAS